MPLDEYLFRAADLLLGSLVVVLPILHWMGV